MQLHVLLHVALQALASYQSAAVQILRDGHDAHDAHDAHDLAGRRLLSTRSGHVGEPCDPTAQDCLAEQGSCVPDMAGTGWNCQQCGKLGEKMCAAHESSKPCGVFGVSGGDLAPSWGGTDGLCHAECGEKDGQPCCAEIYGGSGGCKQAAGLGNTYLQCASDKKCYSGAGRGVYACEILRELGDHEASWLCRMGRDQCSHDDGMLPLHACTTVDRFVFPFLNHRRTDADPHKACSSKAGGYDGKFHTGPYFPCDPTFHALIHDAELAFASYQSAAVQVLPDTHDIYDTYDLAGLVGRLLSARSGHGVEEPAVR